MRLPSAVVVIAAAAATLSAFASASSARVTPSSSCKIVYLRYDRPDGFYAVNPDGSGQQRLQEIPKGTLWADWSSDGTVSYSGAWSPDGKELAGDERAGSNLTRIYVVRADGAGRRTLAPRGDDNFSSWSPDGQRMLFWRELGASKTAIFTINSDGSGVHRVPLPFVSASEPDWSPDGKRLVFSVGGGGDKPGIYVAAFDGTGIHRLTENYIDETPVWSPDGTKIAFTRTPGGDPPSEVDVMSANGSGLHAVATANSNSAWDLGVHAITWRCRPGQAS